MSGGRGGATTFASAFTVLVGISYKILASETALESDPSVKVCIPYE